MEKVTIKLSPEEFDEFEESLNNPNPNPKLNEFLSQKSRWFINPDPEAQEILNKLPQDKAQEVREQTKLREFLHHYGRASEEVAGLAKIELSLLTKEEAEQLLSDFENEPIKMNTTITTPDQYQRQAMRTKKELGYEKNLFHAALGIADEAGEFASAIKRALVYGKGMDLINLVEELGDAMWFISLAADTLEVPLAVVMEVNTAKLQVRYSEGYADAKAQNRVKDLEREAIAKVLTKYGIEY